MQDPVWYVKQVNNSRENRLQPNSSSSVWFLSQMWRKNIFSAELFLGWWPFMFIPLIYGRHIFIHAQKHLLSLFLHDWPGLPYPLLCRTIRWCSYNTQSQHTFHTFPDMVFALQRDVWPGIISLTPLHHIVSFSFNIISSFLLLVCQLNACKSTSCLTYQYDLISKLLLSQLSVIILEWWWNCCWWQSMEGMSGATAADTNQSGGGVRKHKLSVRTTFDLPPESLTSWWYSL